MTLIQTVASPDFILQVSDRRLTWPDGTYTDVDTKLVYWNGYFTVGFTGIARIDPTATEPTAEWIAKTVTDYQDIPAGIHALGQDVAKRIVDIPWEDKRLAVVFAGYDVNGKPHIFELSNMEPDGSTEDQNTFRFYTRDQPPGRPTWHVTYGQPVSDRHDRILRKQIPRILKQPQGVERALRLMVALQRQVRQEQERQQKHKPNLRITVGNDALCVVIPRVQTTPGFIGSSVDSYKIPTNAAAFEYFPEGGFAFQKLGPLIASGGWVNVDLQSQADPSNPDIHSVGIRSIKTPWDD